MENVKKERKVIHKIDVFDDVVEAVTKYDKARLSGDSETEKLHKKAVSMIVKANDQYGDGFVSISKVRDFLQSVHIQKKLEAAQLETKRVQTRRQK